VNDEEFLPWITDELAALPAVLAVALGGSRASGLPREDSDWDLAIYYRGCFDPADLRARFWDGEVSDIGGWGGGVMNGGAWLTIDNRRVDVHYRDLDEVDHWCAEAQAGRFEVQHLLFYVAGIPTYVLMAELALGLVLTGRLPTVDYPEPLAASANRRWRADAIASLAYGESALRRRGDTTVALATSSRGLIQWAHGRLAERREWVLNEKSIVERASLVDEAAALLSATSNSELLAAIDRTRTAVETD
jgi:predicted nucleotidyltransferase